MCVQPNALSLDALSMHTFLHVRTMRFIWFIKTGLRQGNELVDYAKNVKRHAK